MVVVVGGDVVVVVSAFTAYFFIVYSCFPTAFHVRFRLFSHSIWTGFAVAIAHVVTMCAAATATASASERYSFLCEFDDI